MVECGELRVVRALAVVSRVGAKFTAEKGVKRRTGVFKTTLARRAAPRISIMRVVGHKVVDEVITAK